MGTRKTVILLNQHKPFFRKCNFLGLTTCRHIRSPVGKKLNSGMGLQSSNMTGSTRKHAPNPRRTEPVAIQPRGWFDSAPLHLNPRRLSPASLQATERPRQHYKRFYCKELGEELGWTSGANPSETQSAYQRSSSESGSRAAADGREDIRVFALLVLVFKQNKSHFKSELYSMNRLTSHMTMQSTVCQNLNWL